LQLDSFALEKKVDEHRGLGSQDLRLERLEQVVDRALRIPLEDVFGVPADGGDEDDRDVAAAVVLLWFEKDNPQAEPMRRRAMPFAWALLAILAFCGIASTQDLWALAGARVAATRKLEAAGIARVSGGNFCDIE